MTTLNETIHAGAFIVQEMPGYYSRDSMTVALSQTLLPGTVVYDAAVLAGITSAAPVADAGNTGNGVITMDGSTPVLAGVQSGNYRIVCIEPVTNAGTFEVFDPDGVSIGRHIVAGAAFANQIKFAIADGATDFVAGDGFTVAVGREDVTDEQILALPNDGSQVASGIVVYPVVTDGVSTKKVATMRRMCEVRAADLTWPAGISAANTAKAVEELRKIGIILR